MGNWFKTAKDFTQRNLVNSKIKYLGQLRKVLNHISKLVYQSGTLAKNTNYTIILPKNVWIYGLNY